jgi:hypothetical protein
VIVQEYSFIAAELFLASTKIAPDFLSFRTLNYTPSPPSAVRTLEPKEIDMNKLLAVMMVAVLPALALASGETSTVAQTRTLKPVVSVIDLTPAQVQELAKVHGDYQTRKAVLDAEYKELVEVLITAKTLADNS